MTNSHYQCHTCKKEFDISKTETNGYGQEYEVCPQCLSWNYYLTNLSIIKFDDMYSVDYSSPSVGMTLFMSKNELEVRKVYNRLRNLKWEVFVELVSGDYPSEIRKYIAWVNNRDFEKGSEYDCLMSLSYPM